MLGRILLGVGHVEVAADRPDAKGRETCRDRRVVKRGGGQCYGVEILVGDVDPIVVKIRREQ